MKKSQISGSFFCPGFLFQYTSGIIINIKNNGETVMEKYTVLLVDDEEEVIQVIMKKIDWEGLGFSVIGYANNGVKAFEMVEEYQPDVVMTDIKMPYVDGMELAHRIKEEFPATKLLIPDNNSVKLQHYVFH